MNEIKLFIENLSNFRVLIYNFDQIRNDCKFEY
jgi:hypothetical protein